jgi:transcriptional regulator with XRE-family HTH domain
VTATTTRKAAALAFAAKLNELLAEKKMSRRELARRLAYQSDVSFETARTNVHRLLRADHVPTESTRHEIADALSIDRSEFEEAALSGDPFRGADDSAPARRRSERGRGTVEGGEVAA